MLARCTRRSSAGRVAGVVEFLAGMIELAEDGVALRLARATARQSQTKCAEELRALGSTSASQSEISHWENGRTGRQTTEDRRAVQQYVSRHQASHQSANDAGNQSSVGDNWVNVTHTYSGEPLLTERQAALVDAATSRLASGPPMTPDDVAALRLLAALLGLSS